MASSIAVPVCGAAAVRVFALTVLVLFVVILVGLGCDPYLAVFAAAALTGSITKINFGADRGAGRDKG